MTAALATGAVLVTWAVVALVLAGIGIVSRKALLSVFGLRTTTPICAADLWTGLAATTCYLLLWSLAAAIGPLTWIAPLAVATVGLVLLLRQGLPRPALGLTAVPFGVVIVWFANLSIGKSTSHDSGLYHFAIIEYASRFAAIPGLGNLHDRLSAADAHLLLVSFLGVGPWSGAGQHLATGLLFSLLAVHLWTILGRGGPHPRHLVSWRVALLGAPAIVVFVAHSGAESFSSPNLDMPTFVLAFAAAISLAQAVERSFDTRFVVGGFAALATGLATRPLVVPALVGAAGVLLVTARRRRTPGVFAMVGASAVLPIVAAVAVAARQTLLSGYPLFPIGTLSAPVDWKLPESVLVDYRAWSASWARLPGRSPDEVTSWGDWIGGWTRTTVMDGSLTAAAMLVVIAIALPLVFRSARDRSERSERAAASAVILVPSVIVLVAWFLSAPAIRFVAGWIWLVPIGLLAWLAPSLAARGRRRGVAIAVAAVLGIGVAQAVPSNAPKLVVRESGDGPFGSASAPDAPRTRPYVTSSGLRLLVPVVGDQCWSVLWCTPYPTPRLQQRSDRLEDGFSTSRD